MSIYKKGKKGFHVKKAKKMVVHLQKKVKFAKKEKRAFAWLDRVQKVGTVKAFSEVRFFPPVSAGGRGVFCKWCKFIQHKTYSLAQLAQKF